MTATRRNPHWHARRRPIHRDALPLAPLRPCQHRPDADEHDLATCDVEACEECAYDRAFLAMRAALDRHVAATGCEHYFHIVDGRVYVCATCSAVVYEEPEVAPDGSVRLHRMRPTARPSMKRRL